jgi:glycosyltransferase involved in cell wall biosynthesis
VSDSEPSVTTIIATYHRPKLLRRAIKSVLAQTYPHFQVFVYHNASGDETATVMRKLAKDASTELLGIQSGHIADNRTLIQFRLGQFLQKLTAHIMITWGEAAALC